MDRFGDDAEAGRNDRLYVKAYADPADASGTIVGEGDHVGSAVVDLSNALVVNSVSVAEVIVEDSPMKAYALCLGGKLPDDEYREMMVVLSTEAVSLVVSELSRVTVRACDEAFLAYMLVRLNETPDQSMRLLGLTRRDEDDQD